MRVFRGHSDAVTGVIFAIDGSQIATTSGHGDRRAALWDVESGRLVLVYAGHANGIFGIGYVAGGIQDQTQPLLVTGSFDRTLRLWDMETGVTLRVLEGHLAGVTGIAVGTSEEAGTAAQVFSTSNDGTVRRWDVTPLPHQQLLDLPGEAWAAAVAPDGTQVAVGFGDGSLRLYTLPAGQLVAEVENAHVDAITRLVFAPDGAGLASGSLDDSAKLWGVTGDGKLIARQSFAGHDDAVYGIAFSPDGKTLATASGDGRVGLFKVGAEDEGEFLDAHNGRVTSVVFDAGGAWLLSAGFEDRTALLWDLSADPPALIRAFSNDQDELLWAALSSDDKLIAAAGRGNVVDLYRVDDGELLRRLIGHEQTVFRAIFSPDGRQLATVSADATVRFWDLDTGAELFTLLLPAEQAPPGPLWDFDFRCARTDCWLAVPLTRGKLALYDLGPYAQ